HDILGETFSALMYPVWRAASIVPTATHAASGPRRCPGARRLVSGRQRAARRLVVVPGDRLLHRLQPRADHAAAPLPGRGRPDRRRALRQSAAGAAGTGPLPRRAPARGIGAAG